MPSISTETQVIFGNGVFQTYLSSEQLTITCVGNSESETVKIKSRDNSTQQRMMRTMLMAMFKMNWESEYSYESTYAYEDMIDTYPNVTPQNVKAAFYALSEKPELEEQILKLKRDLKNVEDLLALAKKMYSGEEDTASTE